MNPFFAPGIKSVFVWCLAICAATLVGCKKEEIVEEPEEMKIEPPIELCDQLSTGNIDAYTLGESTFTFENNPNAPVDYVVRCFPRIGLDATIEPGTVIEFDQDAGFLVARDGSLKMIGNAGDSIILRGVSPTPGFWSGIAYIEEDDKNELRYVVLDGAGGIKSTQGGPSTALFNNSAGFKITHTTISNSQSDGLYLNSSDDLASFASNAFLNNGGYPLVIHANDFGKTDGAGSEYVANGNNVIRMTITGGSVITVVENQTWQAPAIPVLMDEGTLGIRADLEVKAGFELVMRPDCHLSVDALGSFKAIGTEDAPIVIRGEQDLAGYWEGMYLEGNNVLNQLDYVTIANGGREKPFGAAPSAANLYLATDVENLTLTKCTISKSLACGIYMGGANATLAEMTYEGNQGGDVCE